MSQRYVFWRDPTGRPYKGQDGRFASTHLLRELGLKAAVEGTKISWQGFGPHRLETALKSSFIILSPDGEELNERDSWGIAWGAICDAIRHLKGGKPVSPSEFIASADIRSAAFFRQPFEDYVLVTSLSIDAFPSRSIHIGNSTITSLGRRGKRYPLPMQLRGEHEGSRFKSHVDKTKYRWVHLRTKARTIHEAVDRTISDLTLLRGLWSLFCTYGSWSISIGSTDRKALGVIHIGPVHTLHRYPKGELVNDDMYWFEPEYHADASIFKPEKGWGSIEKHRRKAVAALKRWSYRRELEDLISRYALALDQTNLSIAFLHLWGILEKVTNTVGANYDETIKRSSWFYSDREIAREMIESLRLVRNRLVHSSRAPADEADQIAYMAKMFVEPHLMRLLWNDLKVNSLEEYGRFLSLPTDIDALERGRKKHSLAAKMLKRWRRQEQDAMEKRPAPTVTRVVETSPK